MCPRRPLPICHNPDLLCPFVRVTGGIIELSTNIHLRRSHFRTFLEKKAGKERQVLTLFHSKNSWNVYTMQYRLEIGKIMEEKSARLFGIFREILFIPICIRLSDT